MAKRYRNWQKYRRFRRSEVESVLKVMKKVVFKSPPPYRIKPPNTKGRPPANPYDIILFLLVKAYFCFSYDMTYAFFTAFPSLARKCGMKKVPAPTTVQGLVCKISTRYLQLLIRLTSLRMRGKKIGAAFDSTSFSTKKYRKEFNVRTRKNGWKKCTIKLHGLVTTNPNFPIFLSVKITDGEVNDSPQVKPLLAAREKKIKLGDVGGDSAFLGRENVEAIAEDGGTPIISIKKNTTPKAKGSPEWKKMVNFAKENPQEYKRRKRRRNVIEGTWGGFKTRFDSEVLSIKSHSQKIELLCRVVVWNCVGIAYHNN